VLPDGIFSNQKPQLGKNFGGTWNEEKLVYSMAIFNTYMYYGHYGQIGIFGILCKEKSGNPGRT
jgi:hypothetical protein